MRCCRFGFTDGLYAYKNSKVKKLDVLSDKELKMHPKEIVKDKYGYYWVGDYTYGPHRLKANGTDADGMPKLLRHSIIRVPETGFGFCYGLDTGFDAG